MFPGLSTRVHFVSFRFSVFHCFLFFSSASCCWRVAPRGGGARCDQFQRLHQCLWEGPPVAACLWTFAADHSWAAEPNPDQLLSGTANSFAAMHFILEMNTLQPCPASRQPNTPWIFLPTTHEKAFASLKHSLRLSFYNPCLFSLRIWTLPADPLVPFAVPEKTNHRGYNGVITACSHSTQWQCALQLLRKMEEVQRCTVQNWLSKSKADAV